MRTVSAACGAFASDRVKTFEAIPFSMLAPM